jgi:undecaprenyl-diphosphatase
MEDVLRAIVLGVVQGLTEFLPISSSGHLIIVRELFGWEFTDDLTFDVSLHLGTTVAVLAFFWRDWVTMLRASALWVLGDREKGGLQESRARTLLLVIIGSVPIAIVGFALADWIEDELRDPVVVGVMLIMFGIVLYFADRIARLVKTLQETSVPDAFVIGGSQAIALVPGVSRSGITISAGLLRDLTRTDAARFSFLLSTPAIGGAALLTFADAASEGTLTDDIDIILAGAITSAVVGWASIAFLMNYIQTRSFTPFVIYRLALGFFCIVYFSA